MVHNAERHQMTLAIADGTALEGAGVRRDCELFAVAHVCRSVCMELIAAQRLQHDDADHIFFFLGCEK